MNAQSHAEYFQVQLFNGSMHQLSEMKRYGDIIVTHSPDLTKLSFEATVGWDNLKVRAQRYIYIY